MLASRNVAYSFTIAVVDQANRPGFKSSPTITVGDFKVASDGNAPVNLATLPVVTGATAIILVSLAGGEMNGSVITVIGHDPDNEWDDVLVSINTFELADGFRIADHVLDRDMSAGGEVGDHSTNSWRSMRQALRFIRNKWSLSGTTLTVTKEDDVTTSYTAQVGTTPGAAPVTSIDPAGP